MTFDTSAIVTAGVGIVGVVVSYMLGGKSKNKRDDFQAIVAAWTALEVATRQQLEKAVEDSKTLMVRITILEKSESECKERFHKLEKDFLELKVSRELTRARITELERQTGKVNFDPTVLVVEDDSNDAALVNAALEKEGCQVFVAHSGEVACEMLQRTKGSPFSIIFLDMKLPTMGGVDVLRLAHQLMPRTPCVVTTGFPSGNFMEEATKLGYVELAIKPLTRETIVKIFKTHKIQIGQ